MSAATQQTSSAPRSKTQPSIHSNIQSHYDVDALRSHLSALKLPFMRENYQAYALSAAHKHLSHLD